MVIGGWLAGNRHTTLNAPPSLALPPSAGDLTIRTLNLSGNSIGDPGARALAEAIKVRCS